MSEKNHPNLVLCGGGSGGHLTPSIAIAKEFLHQYPQGKVLFLISQNPLDEEMIQPYFPYKKIRSGKLRRYISWENIKDFFHFFAGIWESYWILKKNKTSIVFSKGGFVSLPVALAAYLQGIPIIAHESDTFMGLANRIIAKLSKTVCTTFPSSTQNSLLTGTPLREEILRAESAIGKKFLQFNNTRKTILFMGASQGALQINEICETLFDILKKEYNIVLISGKGKQISKTDTHFRQYELLQEEFAHVIKSADIVISRAGANSLFELSALKKCSIIIPLDSAAGDHQRKNAKVFQDRNAIILIDPNTKHLAEEVLKNIQTLSTHTEQKLTLENNIATFYQEHAVQHIIQVLQKHW